MRNARFGLSLVTLLLVCTSGAPAQITLPGTSQLTDSGFPPATFLSTPSVATTSGGGTLIVQLHSGDWQYLVPRTDALQLIRVTGHKRFTVGPLPVRVNSLTAMGDFKIVNGGGDANSPTTFWRVSGIIQDDTNDIFGDEATVLQTEDPNGELTGQLVGNGLSVTSNTTPEGNATTSQTPFILGGGLSYLLAVDFYVTVQGDTAFADPAESVTAEFGGISSFSGFRASFNYETVPEPASLAGAAVGAVVLLRLRPATGRRRG